MSIPGMKLIAKGWESYRRTVLPHDAPPIQITECRQAFYAGAAALFFWFVVVADPYDFNALLCGG